MFRRLLVPVDLNDKHSWRRALPVAVGLARLYQAELHVVTVVPDFGLPIVAQYFPKDYQQQAHRHADEALRTLLKEQVPAEVEPRPHLRQGRIYQEILDAVQELGCDLVVMGSHHPELRDYLIGPNALRVVQHAAVSVMVVRE